MIVDYVMSSLKRDERRALAKHFLNHKTLSDDSEMQVLLNELNDEEQRAIKGGRAAKYSNRPAL